MGILYDALDTCFLIEIVLNCGLFILPLRATTYYSEDPKVILFSAELLINIAWASTSISFH